MAGRAPRTSDGGAVYVAEDDEGIAGAVRATMQRGDVWHIALRARRARAPGARAS